MTVSAPVSSRPAPAVSSRLVQRLRQVADRQWVMRVGRGIFQTSVLGLLVWLVIVCPLGFWPGMPLVVRIPLAFVAWIATAWAVGRYLFPAFGKQNLRSAARQVDVALPELQERISSAVELSQESDPRFRGSPELIAHLIRQAEADAQELDPFVVVPGKSVWRWAFLLVVVLGLWGMLLATNGAVIGRGLYRTAVPWSLATLVQPAQYKVDPGSVDVPQGDPLTVTAEIQIPEQEAEELKDLKIITTYPGGQSTVTVMQRTGPRTFSWNLDHALQSFVYQISSSRGESPPFRVRVLTRPAVERLEVKYTFPDYTKIPPRTESDKGGNIDAVVGTKVKVLVHANQPLGTRSRMVIAPKSPDQRVLDMERAAGGESTDYAAEFSLDKPGHWEYQFQLSSLVGQQEMTNGADSPRSIIARPDVAPTVAITSPGQEIRIRPDDVAQVTYEAGDDFGVARLSAIVQVDKLPARNIDLPLDNSHPRQQGGIWNLAVAEELSRQGVRTAGQVTYQLKAVDNCQPVAHETLTPLYVLRLDAKADALAARQAEEKAREVTQAVEAAENKLQSAEEKLKAISAAPADKPLTAQQTRALDQAHQDVADAAEKLSQVPTQQQNDARWKELAQSADIINKENVKPAADALARAQMANDQAQRQNLQQADKQVADARQQLNGLHEKMLVTDSKRQLEQDVQSLAQKQNELAQAMRQGNPNDPQVRQKQEELRQQTEKLLRDHPELDTPDKQTAAARAQELANRVEELQKAQQAMNTPKPAAGPSPQELAQQQEKLNQEINDFAEKQSQALQNAGAQKPDPREQAPISKQLQDQKLSDAAQTQKEQAEKLRQAADKMQQAASKEDASAAGAPDAKKINDQVQQLGQEIQQAKQENRTPTRPGDAANQKAQDLAQQIQRQATQAANNNPAGRQAAEDARKAAQEARQAASQGKAEEAQQKLATASEKLQQAAGNSQSSSSSSPDQMRQAAQQAKELADRQEKLSQQTANAGKNAANDSNQQGRPKNGEELAKEMDRAAQQARQLQRQTQGTSPETSQRAGETAQALQDAARQQRQATGSGPPNSVQSQDAQQQSQQRLGQAQHVARTLGQGSPNPSGSGQNASGQTGSGASNSGQSNSGSSKPDLPASGQPGTGEATSPGIGSAPGMDRSTQQLAQALQEARSAQQRAAQGDPNAARQAAQALSQASESLAKNDQPPTGVPGSGMPAAGSASTGTQEKPPLIPGMGNGGGTGLAEVPNPTSPQTPAAKPEDIGISPGDWARLPPAVQQQLLNSAQQKGPPAYQEMIKDYYTRISQMSAAKEAVK